MLLNIHFVYFKQRLCHGRLAGEWVLSLRDMSHSSALLIHVSIS